MDWHAKSAADDLHPQAPGTNPAGVSGPGQCALVDETMDRRLAALMRRQHGVFALRQAVALGFAQSTISSRMLRGRYRLLLPGVACEHGTPDSWELRAMAALLWASRDAVLTSGSAARAFGWEVPQVATEVIHLLVQQRTRRPVEGVLLHRSISHDSVRDVCRVGPLRCTSPARTVVDLAALLTPRQLREVVAQAMRSGLSAATLSAAMQRAGQVAGISALRSILAELSPLHAACRSWLESAFVDLTAGTGLEPTAMNHPVRDASGHRRRLDAVYLPEFLPVELDGAATHTTDIDVIDDAAREMQVLLAARWLPFARFTFVEVVTKGEDVLAAVEARLSDAGSSRRRSR